MAALDVAHSAVHDHGREKQRVEPWERRLKAGDQAPGEREEEVAGVVDFAGAAVWTKKLVSGYSQIWGIVEGCGRGLEGGDVHHPSHKMPSPVLVGMLFGFFSLP